MPTVIDSFVINIGLDPKNFTASQRAVLDEFKKTQEEAKRRGGEIEDTAQKISASFGVLRNQLLGTFALFAGGRGIKEFSQYLVTTSADAGRFAERIGESTEAISKWVNAARLVGGPGAGAEMMSFMRNLVAQFESFKITGQGELPAIFRGIGVNVFDANNKLKPIDTLLNDMNAKLATMSRQDIFGWVLKLGGSDSLATVLGRSQSEMQNLLGRSEELGPVLKANADAAREIQTAFEASAIAAESMGSTLLTVASGPLIQVLREVTEIFVTIRRGIIGMKEFAKATGESPISGVARSIARSIFSSGPSVPSRGRRTPPGATSVPTPDEGVDDKTGQTRRRTPPGATSVPTDEGAGSSRPGAQPPDDKTGQTRRRAGALSFMPEDERVPSPGTQQEALRMKRGESVAGASIGLLALAASLQTDIAGLKEFTGMNDRFHAGTTSKHAQGNALDFTLEKGKDDSAQYAAAAAQIRAKLAVMNVDATVLDEKNFPSKRATAPHIHVQFNTPEASRKYAETTAGLRAQEAPAGPTNNSRSTQVNITTMNVVTQAKDADGIAREMPGAIERTMNVHQGEPGRL